MAPCKISLIIPWFKKEGIGGIENETTDPRLPPRLLGPSAKNGTAMTTSSDGGWSW